VALNYEGELQSISPYEVNYQLPNGTNLDSTEIRVTVPEGLFDTALLGKYDTGIAFLAHACISKSHRKEELYHNIVLAGGSTLFPGFGARLKQDVGGLLTQ
jgi:centractin